MSQLRTVLKLVFTLLAIWLGLVWTNLLPRPAWLLPSIDIEPLTYLLSAIAAGLFIFWKEPAHESVAEEKALPVPNRPIAPEIRTYLQGRYSRRLSQKLAGRQPVNLYKRPSRFGTSDEGARNLLNLRDEEVRSAIGGIFDAGRGRLLVLGLPGAGKSTLLLQLALQLLEGEDGSIPVFLHLASWRSYFDDLDEWLLGMLPRELGVSNALAEKIHATTALVLLLDGFDEVPEAERASCLDAIGKYGMNPGRRYVISSRLEEYAAAKDAPVYAEIEVAPLTIQQVEAQLSATAFLQPESKRLLNALQVDILLRHAIENPFYFNTAQLLFASGKNWSEFGFQAYTVDGRQQELVQRFIHQALEGHPSEKSRSWLNFLAIQMEKSGKVKFGLTDLQWDWWGTSLLHKIISFSLPVIIIAFVASSVVGVFSGFLGMMVFALTSSFGLAPSVMVLLGWLEMNKPLSIEIVETRDWSWERFKTAWKAELENFKVNPRGAWQQLSGTIRRDLAGDMTTNIQMGTFLGLWAAIFVMILLLYLNTDARYIVFIPITFLAGLIVGFLLGLLGSLFNLIILLLSLGKIREGGYDLFYLPPPQPYSVFKDGLKNFNVMPIVSHFTLRSLLFLQAALPLRLVDFLNEMSHRHILEFDGDLHTGTDGSAWRWRHRILQEYFIENPT